MSRLISRTELARMAGVTQAAVTKACKGPLRGACEGVRIDASHESVQAYLAKHGAQEPPQLAAETAHARTSSPKKPPTNAAAPTGSAKGAKSERATPPGVSPSTGAREPVRLVAREVRDVSEVADMTIRQVVQKFGTVTAFKDWLAALRTIEEVREKNLRNAETDGNLISVRLVRTHVMGAIESGNRRLLSDSPKTIARMVYAAAHSQKPIEEAEKMVRDIISSQLKPMKDAAARTLREQSAA
jgi:hypothetical protein